MMPHVDDGTLHAFLDGALRAEEPEAARRVEAHLEACADCRARLDEAAALRDSAVGVLAALDAGLARQPSGDPDFQDVLARAEADSAMAADPDRPGPADRGDLGLRRQYRWTRGLGWAATIVVALGTGYLARDLAGPTGLGPDPAVRQSTAGEAAPADARDGAPGGESAEAAPAPVGRASPSDPAGTTGRQPADLDGGGAVANRTEAAAGAGEDRTAVDAGAPRTAETERSRELAAAAQAPAPAPETPGDQGPQAGEEAAAADIDGAARAWQPVTPEEAEAVAGAILVLPGARLAATGTAGSEVRTLQMLPGGVEVEVVQAAVGEATDASVEEAKAAEISADEAGPADASAGEPESADASAGVPDASGDSLVPERQALGAERNLRAEVGAAQAPAAAAPTLVGLDLDSVSATVEEAVTVVVARDGLTLRLTGRLPPDVLRALAATAMPRER